MHKHLHVPSTRTQAHSIGFRIDESAPEERVERHVCPDGPQKMLRVQHIFQRALALVFGKVAILVHVVE